jgi:hypothetical protein
MDLALAPDESSEPESFSIAIAVRVMQATCATTSTRRSNLGALGSTPC